MQRSVYSLIRYSARGVQPVFRKMFQNDIVKEALTLLEFSNKDLYIMLLWDRLDLGKFRRKFNQNNMQENYFLKNSDGGLPSIWV